MPHDALRAQVAETLVPGWSPARPPRGPQEPIRKGEAEVEGKGAEEERLRSLCAAGEGSGLSERTPSVRPLLYTRGRGGG